MRRRLGGMVVAALALAVSCNDLAGLDDLTFDAGGGGAGGHGSGGGSGGDGLVGQGGGGPLCSRCFQPTEPLDRFDGLCGLLGFDEFGDPICEAGSSCELRLTLVTCLCAAQCAAECPGTCSGGLISQGCQICAIEQCGAEQSACLGG
ncbi:MAG: hypothetical protein KC731_12255 [Myxococcales bacterium]|nr:hypothetical protein [Myxococcales bacterium]